MARPRPTSGRGESSVSQLDSHDDRKTVRAGKHRLGRTHGPTARSPCGAARRTAEPPGAERGQSGCQSGNCGLAFSRRRSDSYGGETRESNGASIMSVAVYARVSTEEQRERQSIETQYDFGQRFCQMYTDRKSTRLN